MDIDAVVMWVDGSDPEWLKEKIKYSSKEMSDANSVNRYRDWNLMRFWFRSIEKNLPWLRKIFFVTWGHVPDFLKKNHPKLRIVNHEEFIPKQYLPTFSSHTIELNLYRIKDLSEHFILLNDDIFVLNSIPKVHFFRNNLPCAYYSEMPIEMSGEQEVWQGARLTDLRIINKHFNRKRNLVFKHPSKYLSMKYEIKDNIRSILMSLVCADYFTGFKLLHSINAYKKSIFKEVWEKENKALNTTCMHKFRNHTDVNQWVFLWWQIAKGDFMPQKNNSYSTIIDDKHIKIICDIIKNHKYDVICLNDPSEDVDFDKMSFLLHRAFNDLFPDKSSYEL